MLDLEERLRSELDRVPVIDPHCHLRPEKPTADTLADIVLYHHIWIELVSAGMPGRATSLSGLPQECEDPDMDSLERVKAALPYLGDIETTTCGTLLRMLLRDLYDVPDGILSPENVERVSETVAARSRESQWCQQVFAERCHVEKALTVEGYERPACTDAIGKGVEQIPINLVSGKEEPRQRLESIGEGLGCELSRAEDYGEAMHGLGVDYSRRPLHFVNFWFLPHFAWTHATDREVSDVISRAGRGGEIDSADMSAFSSYGVRQFLNGMRTGPLRTVQVIVGAEVIPPHRALTHWSPEFPGALARLASEFEEFHFNCSAASDLYTQDLAILAKHVPNISVAGYWWHVLYPYYLRKSIETRLDIVPANKIVAFFSDAYHAEWCYPKLKLVKGMFGDVLMDRVSRGFCSEEQARRLIRQVFYENPKRIYGVG